MGPPWPNLRPMPGDTTDVDTDTDMDSVTATAATDMERGPLMPTLGAMVTAALTDTDTVTAMAATDTARGPLMSSLLMRRLRSPAALTPTLTSTVPMVPTPTPDTASTLTALTLPTLMALTHTLVSTTTARGLLMPTPGATDMAALTAMDTVTAMAATDMARGPLMPTPGDTTAVDTDTDTGTVATDMARGLLMLMPGDMDTDTATAMVAATTVKPSAVLIALLSVLKMSSHHPHLTKYPSHSC